MKLKSAKTRLVMGLFLAAAIVCTYRFTFLYQLVTLQNLIRWVGLARASRVGTLLFYVLFVFGVMAMPITIFPIIGGLLFPYWIALPLNLAAATTGALVAFSVSRFFGREAVEGLLKGRLKSLDRISATQGLKAVFLLRIVGVPPFTIANYAFGLSAVKVRDFLGGTLLGILPWMTFVTYVAASLWNALVIGGQKGLSKALLSTFGPMMAISATIICTVLSVSFYRRKKAAVR